MTVDLFDEPRAKLARAQRHLTELVQAEAAFDAAAPVEAYVGTGTEGNPAILLRATAFPPLSASAIAGDILNNLRSALDLTISAACRAKGKTNLSSTYFVIAKDGGDGWDDLVKGKRKRMKAASAEIKKLTRSFKPWAGGNDLLFAVSYLVGIDKHQTLIGMSVHQSGNDLAELSVKHPDGKPVRMSGNAFVSLSQEQPSAPLMNFDQGVAVSLKGPNRINVRFAFEAIEPQPYVGAVSILGDALGEITKIVETFAAASKSGALC